MLKLAPVVSNYASCFKIVLFKRKYAKKSKNKFSNSFGRSLFVPFVDCRERSLAIVAGSGPSFLYESCTFSIESDGIAEAIL